VGPLGLAPLTIKHDAKIESFFRMKSTAKQEQLHPQNVCGSLPRGVHNTTNK